MRYIDVTLDKPRRLRFDVNALVMLEKAVAMPLGRIVTELRQVSVSTILTCVQIGLLHEDKNLTADRVGNCIQAFFDGGHDFGDLSRLVTEALEASGVVKPEPSQAEVVPLATT